MASLNTVMNIKNWQIQTTKIGFRQIQWKSIAVVDSWKFQLQSKSAIFVYETIFMYY